MKNPILFTVGIFLIAFAILGAFVFPVFQKFRETQAEVKIKKTDLENNQEYLAALNNFYSEFEELKPQLSKIDSALPKEPSLPNFLDFIQKTVGENGLVLTEISFSKTTPTKEKIKETSLELSITGKYSAFRNLLLNLEKSARLIEIANISFSSKEDLEEVPSFGLIIKVHSY